MHLTAYLNFPAFFEESVDVQFRAAAKIVNLIYTCCVDCNFDMHFYRIRLVLNLFASGKEGCYISLNLGVHYASLVACILQKEDRNVCRRSGWDNCLSFL